MDWKIELSADGKFVRITTQGKFSLANQHRLFLELSGFPAMAANLPVLFDNRLLDMSGSTSEVLRSSVEIVQSFIRQHGVQRMAGLVKEGVNFGVGRQFEILTEIAGGQGFRLFKDDRLAIQWLTEGKQPSA